jgi:hypothetical protein
MTYNCAFCPETVKFDTWKECNIHEIKEHSKLLFLTSKIVHFQHQKLSTSNLKNRQFLTSKIVHFLTSKIVNFQPQKSSIFNHKIRLFLTSKNRPFLTSKVFKNSLNLRRKIPRILLRSLRRSKSEENSNARAHFPPALKGRLLPM